MKATLFLRISLALMGVGTALVFVGVLSPALFKPGVTLIGLGFLGSAISGVLAIFLRADA
jgi:hypothetical protein